MKIFCIGRNYSEHIKELNNTPEAEPVLFMKPDTALISKEATELIIPEFVAELHYETEIVVKINRAGKYIAPEFASKYYDQIALGIDFTNRKLQSELKQKGLPWEKSKSFDNSALAGEFIAKTELGDIDNIEFELKINGNTRQLDTTAKMIWNIDILISKISEYFTLKTGDLIYTGTPSGVGAVREGDLLEGFLVGKKNFELRIK